jgi:hypothetical protein
MQAKSNNLPNHAKAAVDRAAESLLDLRARRPSCLRRAEDSDAEYLEAPREAKFSVAREELEGTG